MKLKVRCAYAILAAAAASPGMAHHSVFGVFDPEAPFTVTGIVTEVEWVNPHVFLHVAVENESGEVVDWRLETIPTTGLRRAGINPDMLMGGGEPVTVTGILAHEAKNMGWVHRITYADGHFYQMSNERLDQGASQPSVPQE